MVLTKGDMYEMGLLVTDSYFIGRVFPIPHGQEAG
jgi:hypothetical protein